MVGVFAASGQTWTNNRYGRGTGVGGGLGLRAQRVTESGFLLGAELGFERVQSRIDITSVVLMRGDFLNPDIYAVPATGITHFNAGFATAYLGLGQRLHLGPQLVLDLLVGPELALKVGANERGHATTTGGQDFASALPDYGWWPLDKRVRAEAAVWRGRAGLHASYSHGLQTYYTDAPTYSRTYRLGVAYRLR